MLLAAAMLVACAGDDPAGDSGGRGGNGSSGSGSSGSGGGSGGSGAGAGGTGFGNIDPSKPPPDGMKQLPPTPNPEAFWATDPPPMQCLQDGTMMVVGEPPGGTLECPSDKNREGCACDKVGETAPCWPGLRANRNRGDCKDGTTTCEPYMEFGGAWGECKDYVLPNQWVDTGPGACRCFSEGKWEIDNLSPCFITYTGVGGKMDIYALSTMIYPDGKSACPMGMTGGPPPTAPPNPWSTNRLTVDCAGHYELCYSIKAGDGKNPKDTDCVLVKSCVSVWYQEAGKTQELPELPGWASPDPTCAGMFQDGGGYGEMTVKGLSLECDEIDDGTDAHKEYVFDRRGYCPKVCQTNPMDPVCANCVQGGSGNF